jgi:SAM-dependent methyltransferase
MTPDPDDDPWDALSDYFDTTKAEDAIPAGAADNILIAWPVIFQFIATHVAALQGSRVLDYGCGAGSFAHQLDELGGQVTGIDPSPAMIDKATAAYGDGVTFLVGDSRLLRGLPPFVLITAIMALQFVADLPTLFADLTQALVPGGHLIFAVHNPAFFQGEVLRFANGVEVPIFIRSAVDYHAVAEPAGLEPLLETYPPFTPEFLGRYPSYAGRAAPEYLILSYRRRGAGERMVDS